MNRRKTVAVYGGAFNPPHNGHMQLAEYLLETNEVDTVSFMPSFNPPHKDAAKMAPYEDRCEMVRRICTFRGTDNILYQCSNVSRLEKDMKGISYTLLLLDELSHRWMDCEFKMVIGADELCQLHTWKPDCIRLVRNYDFIVYLRPGITVDLTELNKHWPGWLCKKLLSGIVFDAPLVNISSSELRESIKQHGYVPADAQLPPSVAQYINEHKLYQGE